MGQYWTKLELEKAKKVYLQPNKLPKMIDRGWAVSV
jgi:hypothetical protein